VEKFPPALGRRKNGDPDLVVQFHVKQLVLQEGATGAVTEGVVLDGTPIMGSDSIRVVR